MKDESTKCYVFSLLFTLGCFMSVAMVLIGAWRERIDMKHITDGADRYDRIVNASDKTTKDDDGKNITVEQTENECTQNDCIVFDEWLKTEHSVTSKHVVNHFLNSFPKLRKSFRDSLAIYVLKQKFMHNDTNAFINMRVDGNFYIYRNKFSEVFLTHDDKLQFVAFTNHGFQMSICELVF